VGALEECWAAVARRHADVPAAVIVVASGTDGRASQARWGHFAAVRWVQEGGDQLPEVLIAGEGLAGAPRRCWRRCSTRPPTAWPTFARSPTPHGRAAITTGGTRPSPRELGLDVAEVGSIGWSSTTLSEQAKHEYRRELARLQAALTLSRRGEQGGAGGRKSNNNLLACTCACDRRIRVSGATLAAGPIVCGLCGEPFTTEDNEET